MSKMFNYSNSEDLFVEAMTWQPLDASRQDYAIKFIFGEIDGARRAAHRAKNNGTYDQKKFDGRIRMLKSLAATIAMLPIPDPTKKSEEYDARAHQECYP